MNRWYSSLVSTCFSWPQAEKTKIKKIFLKLKYNFFKVGLSISVITYIASNFYADQQNPRI